MIKTLAAAAVLSLGLSGYALAQRQRRPPVRRPGAGPRGSIITTIITTTTIITFITCITWLRRRPLRRLPRNKR